MRLVDLLILLLTAHADTLRRLSAFFGEEAFVEMLEEAGDRMEDSLPPTKYAGQAGASVHWLESNASSSNVYAELEGTVQEFQISAVLQFHVWAYPHYRKFIESSVDLGARLPAGGGEIGVALIDEACAQADAWLKALHIPSPLREASEKAAQIPWIRFRNEALKKMGRRPLGAV